MQWLPTDILIEIALNLPLVDILSLSTTSKKIYATTNSQYFWHQKFSRDYFNIPDYHGDWKHLYQNYNSIYVMGKNLENKLILGDIVATDAPVKLKNIKAKHITDNYLIGMDDRLYYFGRKPGMFYGWNNIGTTQTGIRAKWVQSSEYHMIFIDNNDLLYTALVADGYDIRPRPLTNFRVKSASIGLGNAGACIAFIDFDGRVYVLGNNFYGQAGIDSVDPSIQQPILVPNIRGQLVACANNHVVILGTDGSVFVAGDNSWGQLGLGEAVDRRRIFTKIPNILAKYITCRWNLTAIIDINDDLYIFGWDMPKWNDQSQVYQFMDAIYRPKKIWSGCSNVSLGRGFMVFTDLAGDAYFMGTIAGVEKTDGPLYRTDRPRRILGFKATKIFCTNVGFFIIGVHIKEA